MFAIVSGHGQHTGKKFMFSHEYVAKQREHHRVFLVLDAKHKQRIFYMSLFCKRFFLLVCRSPDDVEWEDLDPRAIEAAQWTDREINKVIEQVKVGLLLDTAAATNVYYRACPRVSPALLGVFRILEGVPSFDCKTYQCG